MATEERTPDGVTDDRIVVGVDGSDSSKEALRWAARQAARTGDRLEIITSWELPATYGFGVALPENLDFGGDAEKLIAEIVTEVLGKASKISFTTTVVEGHAALVLTNASEHADLLVVGSRGHGAFAGMLLGSVSTYCIAHADCPVVVVHESTR